MTLYFSVMVNNEILYYTHTTNLIRILAMRENFHSPLAHPNEAN